MVANREAGRQLESKDGCRVHGNSQMQILVGFKPLDFAAARVHLRTSDRSNLRSVVLDDTTTYPETIVLEERRAREAARRSESQFVDLRRSRKFRELPSSGHMPNKAARPERRVSLVGAERKPELEYGFEDSYLS